MKINIITSGFIFNNVRSLLYPLIKFKKFFKKNGIHLNFLKHIETNCDILFIESNFIGKKYNNDLKLLKTEFKKLRKNVKRIIYFDTSDSTSILHPQLIDFVDVYCKGQTLNNLNDYKKKYYGNRIFTDYAFKKFGIKDKIESFSEKINNDNLQKLKIHWNSGIMNHSFLGKIFSHTYKLLPIKKLLYYPKLQTFRKKRDIFINMTTKYSRNTVAWHRTNALKLISVDPNIKRLDLIKYYKQLSESKICLSPFGWGEINYRDFEAFIYGALLVKPDMKHVNTWPQFYDSKNFVSYDWSCKDLKKKINEILEKENQYQSIANRAQRNYIKFLRSDNLHISIYKRILNIINY